MILGWPEPFLVNRGFQLYDYRRGSLGLPADLQDPRRLLIRN